MHTQNRLGIWISKQTDIDKIPEVLKKYSDLDDVFLICNDSISNHNYGIVPSYYVGFAKILVAFVNLEDFIANRYNFIAQNVSLFCSSKEILQSNLDKSFFKDIRIFEL